MRGFQMAEEKAEEKSKSTGQVPFNIVVLASVACLVIGALAGGFLFNFAPTGAVTMAGSADKGAMDKALLSEKVEKYLNDNFFTSQGRSAKVTDVNDYSASLYSVNITVMKAGENVGEDLLYCSKDGKYFLPYALDMDKPIEQPAQQETQEPTETKKSDKPEVELFVMSHCPYGTQAEKGILPVVKLLGDKIDFKVRFVYYSMHGETEVQEEARQYCIQKEQGDKYLSYLECFLADSNSDRCLTEAGIDVEKLNACIAAADNEFSISANLADKGSYLSGTYPLFNTDKALNEKYGVGGSPTLIINGAITESGRSPADYLKTICGAFNSPPEACGQELSSEVPASGFGYSGSGTASGGGCGA